MTVDLKTIRVIALEDVASRENLLSLLYELEVKVLLVNKLGGLARVPPAQGLTDIVLLPDQCPNGDAWVINGVLSQYAERPAFLVYARDVNFSQWAGVLDSGGSDIITAPFSLEKVRTALQIAAERMARKGRRMG